MSQEITIPPIGDYQNVPVSEVLASPGDHVDSGQTLLILESDKATLEIPSPQAGILEDLCVKVGDTVSVGHVIGHLRCTEDTSSTPQKSIEPSPAEKTKDGPEKETRKSLEKTSPPPVDAPPYASPSARHAAREYGVDLTKISGTGKNGRIAREDVEAAKNSMMGSPAAVQRIKRSRIQQIAAKSLIDSWTHIPHVTTCEDADITDLEDFRQKINKKYKESGFKVTILSFLVKICVIALKEFPAFNAELVDDELLLKNEYNIGFAVDTPQGLVVPVIHHADQCSILDISKKIEILSEKARQGKIAPVDISNGTFSISSLGGIGGTYFTPIIRRPEVAILGVCRSQMKPFWNGQTFVPRLILPLSLSWDHRIVDGAMAARFNLYLKSALEDLRLISV